MPARPLDVLGDYGLSARTGFLPEEAPLTRLPDDYYEPWEDLIQNLAQLVSSYKIRSRIDQLPLLKTSRLKTEEEWRRAYVIMGCCVQAYIWVGETPSDRLPPQITIPLLDAASYLGLAPMNTYATIVLWNYGLLPGESDPTNPSNLRSTNTLTGTRTEEWFYLISVTLEARGGPIITELLECMSSVRQGDDAAVVASLERTACHIVAVGALLNRMYEHCEAQPFYYDVRPLLSGTKGHASLGLPKGVFYDEGDGKGSWRQYAGGSNAQSSLIQFLDVALSVKHHATGQDGTLRRPSPSNRGFIEEMRQYMPGRHRDFLCHMEKQAHIREYAMSTEVSDPRVRAAYIEAVAALTQFRNIHLRIVARYIISPSRQPVPENSKLKVGWNLAKTAPNHNVGEEDVAKLQGTGGTKLMAFLKQTRDETSMAAKFPEIASR
ncbi:hypothetical protein PV08_07969 [Exophiala spinifera]|uniref:Indoleamine 2,3-dioxygenase n=1 Tax=Exophiala spinifera TaxID=91928 RepID=A0A0D1ZIU3_9EURO|nr:uncharacterized protein PV08_07969 [Exophiala spinifera]KIW12782.1 hypothetical protein PV08_07969 [Exophiala spinifera]